MPTRQEIIEYITQAAQRRGIDPNTALRVIKGESSFNPSAKLETSREASYGLAQLNVKGGLGVEARKRGIEPTDPSQWKQHIDFSFDTVKRDGWRQWSAAKNAGIGRWDGVGASPPRPPADIPTKAPRAIDITDTPTLKTLNPPTINRGIKGDPTIPLSQLAPTEASNTMARHPSFDQAINSSIDQISEGGRRNFPKGMQYAGVFVPPIRGPKGRLQANPMAPALKHDRLPPPEKVPGPRTQTLEQERQAEKSAYERRQEQRARADRIRRGEPADIPEPQKAPIAAGPPAPGSTADIQPKGVRTSPINAATTGVATTGAGTAAIGGMGGTGATDPAVAAVQQAINSPPIDDTGGLGIPPQAVGPQPAGPPPVVKSRGAQPMSPENPDVTRQILSQAMPVMKEVMRDPQAQQAAKVLAQKTIQTKARQDAMQADMQSDPAFYQHMASRRQQQQMPNDPNNPLAERQMMDAVARDYQNPRRAPQASAQPPMARRGPPQEVSGAAKMQDRVPIEQEIVARNMGLNNPNPQGSPYPLPQGASDPTGGMGGVRSAGQMPMDPAMMQLMQFFTGGGGLE